MALSRPPLKMMKIKFFHRCPLIVVFVVVIAASFGVSCSQSKQTQILSETEKIATEYPDSALAILESIDPSDLKADSLRAKLYYLKAYGHMSCHRSMVGDSLITFAHNYYRGKDIVKDVRSGIALAWYRSWAGDTPDSIAL